MVKVKVNEILTTLKEVLQEPEERLPDHIVIYLLDSYNWDMALEYLDEDGDVGKLKRLSSEASK